MTEFEKIIITNDHVVAFGKNHSMIIRYDRIDIEEQGELTKLSVQYSNEYIATLLTRNLLVKVS